MAAPKGNKNAEKWTIETATELFAKAIELSKNSEYDFIGEIAYDLDEDKSTFDYLIDKFPELTHLKVRLKNNCETNCFRNLKKENINTAAGIINLKANHGWTDRISQEVNGNLSFNLLNIDPLADYETNNDTTKDSSTKEKD